MSHFRRVDDERAGSAALGILVPPSRRTFVILRPRSLEWDLPLIRADGAFHDMSREEASVVADQADELKARYVKLFRV